MVPALACAQVQEASFPSDPKQFEAALKSASNESDPGFSLQVYCSNHDGIRSFDLYPDGIAIWNRATQVRLSGADRSALLNILLDRDFASFATMYGGKNAPGKTEAPFRVSCQVTLQIGELKKSSSQQVVGAQSAELSGLAAALLERVEPLAATGITAQNLQDGLEKLAGGKIAAPALTLRLLSLPADASKKEGSVLRISAGKVSRQAYAPGQKLGNTDWVPLEPCALGELAVQLKAANLEEIPINLWSESLIELSIQLLGHRKTMSARQFTRLKSMESGDSQQRFNKLVEELQTFDPLVAARCDQTSG